MVWKSVTSPIAMLVAGHNPGVVQLQGQSCACFYLCPALMLIAGTLRLWSVLGLGLVGLCLSLECTWYVVFAGWLAFGRLLMLPLLTFWLRVIPAQSDLLR